MLLVPTFFPWVSRIGKTGSTPLYGTITISPGSNITINQVGQDIEIVAAGGGGGDVVGPGGATPGYAPFWGNAAGTLLTNPGAAGFGNAGGGTFIVTGGLNISGDVGLGGNTAFRTSFIGGDAGTTPTNAITPAKWIECKDGSGVTSWLPLYT